ncbi:MAG: ribonuclease P protein component [Mangrovibacterium sp.]
MSKIFGLSREERLRSRKAIGKLFSGGQSFFVFPLKVAWIAADSRERSPVRAAFSVSRRNFRRAVKRNLLKRRMREAYRRNKHILYEAREGEKALEVMFIYAGCEVKDLLLIEQSMKQALRRLASLAG